MVVYALSCCFFRLIDVGAMNGLTRGVDICSSYGVIEEEYALSTRYMVQDQFLNFWIIDLFNLVLGGKVLAIAGDVGSSGEAVGVQFKVGFLTANVGNLDGGGVFGVVPLGQAWWWLFYVVPGC
jgi:hypothetical protein